MSKLTEVAKVSMATLIIATSFIIIMFPENVGEIKKTIYYKTINRYITKTTGKHYRIFKRIYIIAEKLHFTNNTWRYFKNVCLDENDVVFQSKLYNGSLFEENITLPSCSSNSGYANLHVSNSGKKLELFDAVKNSLVITKNLTMCNSTAHCCCINIGPSKSHLQMMLCIALNLYPQAKIILVALSLSSDNRLLVYQTQRYVTIESTEDKVICPYTPGKLAKRYSGWHYTKNLIKSQHVKFDTGFGNSLIYFLNKKTVIDIGCGVGQLGHFLSKNNADINWSGFDGGDNVEELIGTKTPVRGDQGHIVPKVCWVNAGASFDLGLKYDWVIAVEVGEHIPKANEQSFLDNLVLHSIEGVILSWAVKGQGGHQHVNEQSNVYVIDQMEKRGLKFNSRIATKFRKSVKQLYWLRNTIMVFNKRSL